MHGEYRSIVEAVGGDVGTLAAIVNGGGEIIAAYRHSVGAFIVRLPNDHVTVVPTVCMDCGRGWASCVCDDRE